MSMIILKVSISAEGGMFSFYVILVGKVGKSVVTSLLLRSGAGMVGVPILLLLERDRLLLLLRVETRLCISL